MSADRQETAAEAAAAPIRFSACEKVIAGEIATQHASNNRSKRAETSASLEAFVLLAGDTSAAGENVDICRECSTEIVPLDKSTIGVVAINRIA